MSHTAAKQTPETELEPRFENGKPLLIAGLRKIYAPAAMRSIPAQWQAFAPHIWKTPGQVGGTTYGVCWQAADSANIEYLSGVEVSTFAGMPDDFTVVSLPDGFRNPATSPPLQLTLKHLLFLNVIVKNSIRRPGWAA